MTRRHIIAGNWKMYKTIPEAVAFVEALKPRVKDLVDSIYLAVPFTAIASAAETAQGSKIVIGAQNMNDAAEGAFTGEIAARMLLDAGAKFVVLGHSERRHIFGESCEMIKQKVEKSLAEELEPIICIGETLEQRERGHVEEVLTEMIGDSLHGLTAEQVGRIVLAYEPVWAIGTGHTATPEQANQAHRFCREVLEAKWNAEAATAVPILYGGSVKPANASQLMEEADIDGLLVGGASLDAEQFAEVLHYQTLG